MQPLLLVSVEHIEAKPGMYMHYLDGKVVQAGAQDIELMWYLRLQAQTQLGMRTGKLTAGQQFSLEDSIAGSTTPICLGDRYRGQ